MKAHSEQWICRERVLNFEEANRLAHEGLE